MVNGRTIEIGNICTEIYLDMHIAVVSFHIAQIAGRNRNALKDFSRVEMLCPRKHGSNILHRNYNNEDDYTIPMRTKQGKFADT